jgi:myo-inositol 2-dehydrogenase/D-chiro-inositol 1-dehydrogenase
VPFQIGFHRRFDPSHSALRRALDGGEVGDIELVCITNRGGGFEVPPLAYFERTPGSMWKDMLIHDFDLTRWLLGEEVTGVYAAASCRVESRLADLGEVDTALVSLTTRSGALCHINASFRPNFGYDQRIEVFGSKAVVELDNVRPTSFVRHSGEGVLRENPFPDYLTRYRDCYPTELDAFIAALQTGATPSPGIDDGLGAIRLADAALRSHRDGTPVTVPE